MTGTTPTSATSALDERYGRSRRRGVDRRLAAVLIGLAVLLGAVVLIFGGWQRTSTVDAMVIHYTVQDARTVVVDFEVTAPPRTPVACAVEALSESYATVGWKVIELPPSELRTRTLTERLTTTYPATTGTLRSCWPLERRG